MRPDEPAAAGPALHPNDHADDVRPDRPRDRAPIRLGDGDPVIGPDTVVVGVDTSDAARAALRWASGHVRGAGLRLVAVAVWQEPVQTSPRAARGRTEAVAGHRATVESVIAAETGEPIPVLTERGHPGAVLSDRARDAALLVLGNPRPGRLTAPASTTVDCLRTARVPVVLVPAVAAE